ncbi:MAG: sortase [Firmicutes bacterium]|nr:sortase [Bacillota bacterium]
MKKKIEVLYFASDGQPRWEAWARSADEVQQVRLKDAKQLSEELDFGLFAYDTLMVFAAENMDPKDYIEAAQNALTPYKRGSVLEEPLTANDGQKAIALRGGIKQIILVDPARVKATAPAAPALSERPRTAVQSGPAVTFVPQPPEALLAFAAPPPVAVTAGWDVGAAPKQRRTPAARKWPVRAVLALLAVAILCCSAYYANYFLQEAGSQRVNDQMSVLYHESLTVSPAPSGAVLDTPAPSDISQPQQVAGQSTDAGAVTPLPMVNADRFASLLAIHSDVIGWLQIPGTKIDYAVVQPPDQSFYLTHDIKKNKNSNGNPFLGAESRIDDTGVTTNVTIYGHNNKNKTMFGTLSAFKDIDYLRTSPLISFDTLYGDGEYKVVAVMIVATLPSQDNGQFFDFGQGCFTNYGDYFAFVSACQARSIINTGVDVQPGDQLLTLVTCTYEFSDARLAVLARQVRAGENTDGYLANVTANPNPLYPQVWYDKFGGTKPTV